MHIWAHFRVITRHRHLVVRHCFRAGIPFRGLLHDLSKYSPTEFIPGAKYFQGDRSPNERAREIFGYSSAWMHHKGRNKHHYEYWVDYNPREKKEMPVEMPKKFLVEMFCDRVAASKVYAGENYNDGFPLAYFRRGKTVGMLHPNTAALLESLLVLLSEQGEKAAFCRCKQLLKEKKEKQ